MIEVYCDAGISPSSMPSPTASLTRLEWVGRIVVLIPSIDYGFIRQVREGILNKKGNPASNLVEIMAIRKAKEICLEKRLSDYVILTDILAKPSTTGVQEAQWLPWGRVHLASLFLQRVMDRAGYLRSSSRKVITRRPVGELQAEEFRLFNADRLEFELSKSALWRKIQSEIARMGETG